MSMMSPASVPELTSPCEQVICDECKCMNCFNCNGCFKYHQKRQRNNISVRKSREKKKKQMDCIRKQIELLEQEKQDLKAKISDQKLRYKTLRDLYTEAISLIDGGIDEEMLINDLISDT